MKLGLVVEGGGMKCAYTAGILDELADLAIPYSYAIGVSAGSSCLASFLAGQKDRNRRFFVDYVTDPRYLSFRNYLKTRNLFGLDYIYRELTDSDGRDPLDYEAMQKNPSDFEVVATDVWTAEPHYFQKKEIVKDDYRVFMASCAIPIACAPVNVEEKLFFDGGVSDPIPCRRALEQGCDKLIVVLCRPRTTVRTAMRRQWTLRYTLGRYPKIAERLRSRHKYYNESLHFARKLEAEGKALILAPREALPVNTYTKDPQVLQGLYDQALEDFPLEIPRLKAFVTEDPTR